MAKESIDKELTSATLKRMTKIALVLVALAAAAGVTAVLWDDKKPQPLATGYWEADGDKAALFAYTNGKPMRVAVAEKSGGDWTCRLEIERPWPYTERVTSMAPFGNWNTTAFAQRYCE